MRFNDLHFANGWTDGQNGTECSFGIEKLDYAGASFLMLSFLF